MAGRPKKDDSREKQYRVRLNDEEDKMLDYASQATASANRKFSAKHCRNTTDKFNCAK